jgi:uncharacterized protein YndB with AHSA1/START domain
MSTYSIHLHRVLKSPPERVYKAFLDPDAMVKWLPPNGFTGEVHHMEVKPGGSYKMSFTNFATGKSHSFGGRFLELEENKLIKYSDKFDDPDMPEEMETTIYLKKSTIGTELNIDQKGKPESIPEEACYLGWQESLNLLKLLVEAEITDD